MQRVILGHRRLVVIAVTDDHIVNVQNLMSPVVRAGVVRRHGRSEVDRNDFTGWQRVGAEVDQNRQTRSRAVQNDRCTGRRVGSHGCRCNV